MLLIPPALHVLWLAASALAIGAALWLLARQHNRARWLVFYGVLVVYLLFSGAYAVAHRLTGKGIDISVIFHMQTGLEGTGWVDFLPVLVGALAWVCLSLVLPAWLIQRLRLRTEVKASSSLTSSRSSWLSVMMVGAAWGAHPGVHDLSQLGMAFWRPATQINDPYFKTLALDPSPTMAPARDLVWVYLESLERGYLDPKRFPRLTPNLSALDAQALSFTQIEQVEGTGWTIGGMVSSQCGVPLLDLADGNALTGADRFMSNARCLGDLLSQQGHRLQYIGGASLAFAGKGAFYRTHGFEAQGLDELKDKLPPSTPKTGWGLYDDTLYDQAWLGLTTQTQQDSPLGLFMLTLDTHHPNGHASPACRDLPYGDGRNPMLNAVHCADKLVGQFVTQLQQHPRLKDALVVISSDHLAMPNTATHLLDQGPRRNLLMMLGTDYPAQQIDRKGSTLDTGPTVLQRMGLPVPALGYGRDLLGSELTLVEQMGAELDDFLLGRIPVLRALWKHPDLSHGLQWTSEHLLVDKRQLPLPLLLQIDTSHRISSVAYPGGRALAELLPSFSSEQSILWVDQCPLLTALNGQTRDTPGLCMAVGQAGGVWDVVAIEAGGQLSFDALREKLRATQSLSVDPEMHSKRSQQVANWLTWGTPKIDHVLSVKGLKQRVVLHSSGQAEVASFANSQTSTKWLSRGLSLLQLPPKGELQKLVYRDTCAAGADLPPPGAGKDKGRVAQAIGQAGSGLLVVVAHDSAVCGASVLPALFAGSPFTEATALGFRQPYIGLRLPDGSVHEFSGTQGHSLTVALMPLQD